MEELSGPSQSDDEELEGGKVTGKVEARLEAPLENVWTGLWMVGCGL